jgi:hypothetical protein
MARIEKENHALAKSDKIKSFEQFVAAGFVPDPGELGADQARAYDALNDVEGFSKSLRTLLLRAAALQGEHPRHRQKLIETGHIQRWAVLKAIVQLMPKGDLANAVAEQLGLNDGGIGFGWFSRGYESDANFQKPFSQGKVPLVDRWTMHHSTLPHPSILHALGLFYALSRVERPLAFLRFIDGEPGTKFFSTLFDNRMTTELALNYSRLGTIVENNLELW